MCNLPYRKADVPPADCSSACSGCVSGQAQPYTESCGDRSLAPPELIDENHPQSYCLTNDEWEELLTGGKHV